MSRHLTRHRSAYRSLAAARNRRPEGWRIYHSVYRDRPSPSQAIVADFMREGHFARHIKRMRKLYADRRSALAGVLAEVFGDRISVELQAGGRTSWHE